MEYPRLTAILSVNGMKRDVCVDEPDSDLPAVRFRAVFWHGLAISVHTTDASSSPRSPPRAYAGTYCLSSGSPAIPPLFKASVLVSIARQEHVAYLN
jgi:hypothetical protein